MKPGAGSFTEEPDIYEIHTSELIVQLEPPAPIHADGELYMRTVSEAHFRILPGRIPILAN
jgi:diacylglycerol kinase family enzyme